MTANITANADVLRAAFGQAANGIALTDAKGCFLDVNAAFGAMVGSTAVALPGKSLADLAHPDDRAEMLHLISRVRDGIIAGFVLEHRSLRPDGTIFWMKSSVSGVRLPGHLPTLIVFGEDVTERKEAEATAGRSWAEMEETLKVVERQRREKTALLEATAEGIYGIDRDSQCTFANPAAAALLGYDREELLGKDMHQLIHHHRADGTTYPADECPIRRAFETGAAVHVDGEVLWRKDGSSFVSAYSTAPLLDGDRIVGAVISFVDRTEEVRVERDRVFLAEVSDGLSTSLDLRETLDRVAHLAVPFLGDWCQIYLVDPNGALQCRAAHGQSSREHLVRSLVDRFPLDLAADSPTPAAVRTGSTVLQEVVDAGLLGKIAPESEHLRILQALEPGTALSVPLRARGVILGAIVLVRDRGHPPYSAAEARLAEELARRAALAIDNARLYEAAQNSRLRAERAVERTAHLQMVSVELASALTVDDVAGVLVDQALAALGARAGSVALLDTEANALDVIRTVGYPPDAVERFQRVSAEARFPLTDCVRDGEALFLRSGAEREVRYPHLRELRARNGDGAMAAVPLSVNGRVLGAVGVNFPEPRDFPPEERELLLSIARQCAQALERASLYEAEKRARAAAEAAVQVREEFLSIAAHELKTPLTSLRGTAQLLLRGIDKGVSFDLASLKQRIAIIDAQSRKLSVLVSQLLDVSRLEAGRLRLDRREVDLFAVVQDAVAQAQARSEGHAIQLRGEATRATVDPIRLEQVVTNLLDNAIKYSPDGGSILAEVFSLEPGQAAIAVTDSGIGISVEHRPHIFDRFYQAHANAHLSGLGLGLYISRQIVELHGGTLRATFPASGGTRFEVILPVHS